MGWSNGTRWDGVEAGYGLEATCAFSGCEETIDRGISYTCGGHLYVMEERNQEGDLVGCGGFFCGEHLYLCDFQSDFVCDDCCALAEAAFIERHTEEEIAFLEDWEQGILDQMLSSADE